MALGALFLLDVIIAFSFVVSSLFMFLPKKNETVHKIFFALAVMLSIFITVIDTTSLPTNMKMQTVVAWLGLVPSAIGIIITAAKGKPNTAAKLLVMLTSIFGALGYFFFL